MRLLHDEPEAQQLATVQKQGQISGLLEDLREVIFAYHVRSQAFLVPFSTITWTIDGTTAGNPWARAWTNSECLFLRGSERTNPLAEPRSEHSFCR